MEPNDKTALDDCQKIIEFWRLGYTDREIREKLNLNANQFTYRLRMIQADDSLTTETMMFFEKEALRLGDLYKRTLVATKNAPAKDVVAAVRVMVEIIKTRVDIAQRLNAIDPQRFVVEHVQKEEDEVRNLSTEELVARYHEKLNKHNLGH